MSVNEAWRGGKLSDYFNNSHTNKFCKKALYLFLFLTHNNCLIRMKQFDPDGRNSIQTDFEILHNFWHRMEVQLTTPQARNLPPGVHSTNLIPWACAVPRPVRFRLEHCSPSQRERDLLQSLCLALSHREQSHGRGPPPAQARNGLMYGFQFSDFPLALKATKTIIRSTTCFNARAWAVDCVPEASVWSLAQLCGASITGSPLSAASAMSNQFRWEGEAAGSSWDFGLVLLIDSHWCDSITLSNKILQSVEQHF
jgi:hypothetical protein